MLESQNISFSYDGKTEILRSADIQLYPGELVLLTGPTGSGKSTLAKCLTGFIPRSIEGEFNGVIRIDGEDATDYSISKFSRLVSLVQQDPDSQIVTLQVADEVAFGPENYEFEPKMIENLINSSLSAVDCSHLINRITHTLSGGEKQRLAIAAMLSNQPKYLILDEPTASLDPKGILALRKILTGLKEKHVGILCIEHNLDTIRPIANRILTISSGTLSSWDTTTYEPDLQAPTLQSSDNSQILSLENVSFSYDKIPVLQDVSLSVNEGDVIALMGSNGSGKTTLISILGGLLEPNNGRVHLGASLISKIDTKDLPKKVSIVFQNPTHQIFERTVWKEQILTSEILGDVTEETLDRSRNLLQAANLDDYLDRNPFTLSHGQKRRLNVTSVLVHSPDILLLDEPFIGQDKEGRSFILDKIASVSGAALIVTHNPNFAKNHCNRVIFVENGRILLDGIPETVLQQLNEIGHTEYSEMEVKN